MFDMRDKSIHFDFWKLSVLVQRGRRGVREIKINCYKFFPSAPCFFLQSQELIITPWGLSGVQNPIESNMPHTAAIYTLYRGHFLSKVLEYIWGIYSPHTAPMNNF